MRTQSQSRVKPSQVHQDPELLRQKAAESNRKRKERVRQEEERVRQEEERVRQEEERVRQEEERVRQEEKMWSEVKKETKKEKGPIKQGKIKTRVDGIEFDSLAKSMAYIDPVLWGKENDYRTSCWIKINRQLKKDGVCVYGGHTYELIK